jgi:hypothetical protein
MSYILEALKKSDAEQSRARAPDIHTHHDPTHRQTRTRRLPLTLIAVNLALACAVVAFMLEPNVAWRSTASPTAAAPPMASSIEAAAPPRSAASASPEPSSPRSRSAARHTQPRRSAASYIDGLTFSSHIYASDASLRAVTINGSRLSEGDHIGDQLILREITQDGVVLEANGERFTVGVLKDWSRR